MSAPNSSRVQYWAGLDAEDSKFQVLVIFLDLHIAKQGTAHDIISNTIDTMQFAYKDIIQDVISKYGLTVIINITLLCALSCYGKLYTAGIWSHLNIKVST